MGPEAGAQFHLLCQSVAFGTRSRCALLSVLSTSGIWDQKQVRRIPVLTRTGFCQPGFCQPVAFGYHLLQCKAAQCPQRMYFALACAQCTIISNGQRAMGNGQWAMPEAYHVPEYSALLGRVMPPAQKTCVNDFRMGVAAWANL